MSSSPLPSLNELVMKIPQSLRQVSPGSPLHHSAFSRVATSLSRNTKQSQALLPDQAQSSISVNKDSIDTVQTEKPITKEKPSKNGLVKTRDRAVLSQTVKKKGHKKLRDEFLVIEEKTDLEILNVENCAQAKPRKAPESRSKKLEQRSATPSLVSRQIAKEPEITQKKARRKKTALKIDKTTQSQIPRGKVTKLSVSLSASSKFQGPDDSIDEFSIDPYGYGLDDAVKRRRDWTPPALTNSSKITSPTHINTNDGTLSDSSSTEDLKSKSIAGLFGNFLYTGSTASPIKGKPIEKGQTKRKMIELVKTHASNSEVLHIKEKATKKKTRTLTDLATSLYADNHDENESASILRHFQTQTIEETCTPKPKELEGMDPKNNSSVLNHDKNLNSALLSPDSAMNTVGAQDFVFGTSSQLAREDSPTFLRDLHKAMQLSNNSNQAIQVSNQSNDPFASSPVATKSSDDKQNLWGAASRDCNGSLLNVELIDLAISPNIVERRSYSPISFEEEWHSIDNSLFTNPTPCSDLLKPTNSVEACVYQQSNSPRSSVNSVGLCIDQQHSSLDSPKSNRPSLIGESSKKANHRKSKSSTRSSSDVQGIEITPNFESYTNAQLAKELSGYRFKPVKKREQMITLLQKCWEGKQRMKLDALNSKTKMNPVATSDSAENSAQCKTLSPRRKKAKKSEQDCEKSSLNPNSNDTSYFGENLAVENYNLQLKSVRSKSSRSNSRTPAPISEGVLPKNISLSRRRSCSLSPTSSRHSSRSLSPTQSSQLIFSHITQAIKNSIPSKKPSDPSWYEKILLYDPIVLEDLTVWLNTGALEKTHWDGEVEPLVVKKWCESKSICCVWRENIRGGARNGG